MDVGIERHLPGAAVGSSCVESRVALCCFGPARHRANASRDEKKSLDVP